MDATPSYHVIFSGKLREGFEPQQVRQTLAEKMKLQPPQIERLFSGKPQVIKRTQVPAEAKKLVAMLASIGAIARIQSDQKKEAAPAKPQAPSAKEAPAKKVTESPKVATPKAKPAPTLAKYSPFPKGIVLKAALVFAALGELGFAALYTLALFACSLGLIHLSLFTSWGMSVFNFGPLALLLQVVVLALGLFLLFFIAKPLLSLKRQRHHGILVTAEQEPALHAFVEEVCEQINAPVPQQIRINNDVAVELGYLRGAHGFFLNRTVLSIGTPLAAAIDSSQMAALLAQSLQLFHSKSLSPHFGFLLRHIDAWLQQAIYGKDVIDETLANMIAEEHPFALLAAPMQRLIALSRKALGLRLQLSRLLNRRLIHQLVAEADKVALVFCGSERFTHLIQQQRLVAFTSEQLLPGLRERWTKEGTLPDNLVQATLLRAKKYPDSVHQKLRAIQEIEKATTQDTIPADSQRLHRVSKLQVTAAHPSNTPATELFRNFAKLAKTMTVRLYHNRLAIPVSPYQLTPLTAPSKAVQQQQLQIDAIFHRCYNDTVPLKLGHRLKMMDNYDESIAQRAEALKQSTSSRSHAELAARSCVETEEALNDITSQELLYRADLWKQWELIRLKGSDLDHIHTACREQEKSLDEGIGMLTHQLQPNVQRLAASLSLLGTTQGGKVANASALNVEVNTLSNTFDRIEQTLPQLRSLRLHTLMLRTLLSYDGTGSGKLHDSIVEQASDIQQLLAGLGATLKTTPHPFAKEKSQSDLMSFALRNAYPDEGPEGDYDRGNDLLEQVTLVERQILARLCAIALHVEKSLAL